MLHAQQYHSTYVHATYIVHTPLTCPLTTDPAIDEVVANRINGTPLGDDAVRR